MRNPRLEVYPKGISQDEADRRRRALPELVAKILADRAAYPQQLAAHIAEENAAAERMAAKAARVAAKKPPKKPPRGHVHMAKFSFLSF